MDSQAFVPCRDFERLKDRVGNGPSAKSHSERITILETNQVSLSKALDGIRKQVWAVIILLVTLLGGVAASAIKSL